MANGETATKHEALQPLHPSMRGKLDPAFEKLYNEHVANTPLRPVNLTVLRTKYSALYGYATAPAPDVGRIYDTLLRLEDGTDIALRIYEPDSPGPWPVHIDFHGGGWGLGDLETESHICKHYCKRANVAVVDVAYRLVPEHPFPAAITDSFAAVQHIYKHGADLFQIKPDSISIGGVSAGGSIALTVAHLARDSGISLRLVTAACPPLDDHSKYSTAAQSPFASMQENEFAPTLNWARVKWFDDLKWSSLPTEASAHAKARHSIGWLTNLFAAPNYEGLPRTVLYSAGADPLRDEGEKYAMILATNGVEVTVKRFPGVPHPFMHMDAVLWQAKQFIDLTAREIRLAHWGP